MKDKTVEIVPIIKSTSFIENPNHQASFLAPGATNTFTVPLKSSTGKPVQILSDEERQWLEKEMEVDLNHNKHKDNYFENYSVVLGKTKVRLNLEDPFDFLKYKVLKANRLQIAPNKKYASSKGTYKYYIKDNQVEAQEESNESDFEEKLYGLFGELKKDRQKMLDFMVLNNKVVDKEKVADSFLISFLRNKYIKGNKEDQKEFVHIMEDKNFETRLLISKALKAKAITKYKNNYSLTGGETIAHSYEDLVKYLDDNQETRVLVEERIKNAT